MIDEDDVLVGIGASLGHLCVPFSTVEEAQEGADYLIQLILRVFKSYCREKQISHKSTKVVGELFLGLHTTNSFGLLAERLEDTLKIIDEYTKESSVERATYLRHELKSRGLI